MKASHATHEAVKYENVMMWDTYTSVGKFVVLLLVQIFTAGMVNSFSEAAPSLLRMPMEKMARSSIFTAKPCKVSSLMRITFLP